MEVTRALFGSPPAASGSIKIAGREARLGSPAEAKRRGIGFVSEDRKVEGLVLGMKVGENLTLGNWRAISRGGIFQSRRERGRAEHWTQVLGIRARGGPAQIVGTLSGGNQQKVVLARWLESQARVLLLAEPTRGVDVGARADIYRVLEELREQGLALVLVSTDMEEVLALSDRVLVFGRGRIVREFDRAHATQQALLAAAAGEEAAPGVTSTWSGAQREETP
jgi:ABC-type sugar transport system ATPase subunit